MDIEEQHPALPALGDPIALGGRTAANHLALAPMTNKQSHSDGTLSSAEIEWLTRRARGGFGTVITGGWAISPEARVWAGQAALYEGRSAAPLAELGHHLSAAGALGIVQLIHGGSRYSPEQAGREGLSASAGPGWREASERDIVDVINAHRVAAEAVATAGLAGVEVHSAHGYLPAQFLSPTENLRTDSWGGDLAGRSRFLRASVRAIRAAVPSGFVVGVRLSAEDRHRGITLEDTAQVAAWLVEDGMDYLHLSLGDALASSRADPSRHPLDVIRPAVPADLPIIAAGSIKTPSEARQLLRRGADVAALGLAAISEPAWPRLAAEPGWTPAPPPHSPEQLAAVGVTAPFLAYLREGWPDLFLAGRD